MELCSFRAVFFCVVAWQRWAELFATLIVFRLLEQTNKSLKVESLVRYPEINVSKTRRNVLEFTFSTNKDGKLVEMTDENKNCFCLSPSHDCYSRKLNELCLIKHILIALKETETLIIQTILKRVSDSSADKFNDSKKERKKEKRR